MLERSLSYYLVKINRVTGWTLFVLVTVFIVTGFAITGQYGFSDLIEPNTAKEIHQLLVWPVIGTFVVHFLLNLYFALRRWRVIRWKAS